MADETKTAIDATAEAAQSATESAGEAAKAAAASAEKTAKQAASSVISNSKRAGNASRAAAKGARPAKPRRAAKTRKAPAAVKAAAAKERIETVTKTNTNNWFASFGALPAAAPLQDFFAQAGERSQEAVKRSQKTVEQLADLSRANVEALVDAGKIAVEGARALGQDVVETSREGVEQAADAVRALAEAKSPTEFIQLQSELARAQFDRFVAQSSRLTESMVKLAGEAIQPLSTRATLNAERINQIVA